MPTEAELRAWMRESRPPTAPGTGLDAPAVIRRSRRRRLPRQLAAGGTLSLAIAALGVAGALGLRSPAPMNEATSSSDSSAESGAAGGSAGGAIEAAPAHKLNLCGGTLAQVAPSEAGLVLTARFPAIAPATGQEVSGTVLLTNTSEAPVAGTTTAAPAITVSQDGIVLWHSNGQIPPLAVEVDLAPGESIEYPASFTPVRCEVEDDSAESFRDTLPALAPGTYDVSAAIDLLPRGDAAAPIPTITGPASPVTLD